nr:hypothetical protein [Tanacetum cinerariifolium]
MPHRYASRPWSRSPILTRRSSTFLKTATSFFFIYFLLVFFVCVSDGNDKAIKRYQEPRRMIPEPGDANRKVTMTETFHVQTDDELTEKELKQIEADDQAIRTILLGLPETSMLLLIVVKLLRKSGYEFSK